MNLNSHLNSLKTYYVSTFNPSYIYIKELMKNKRNYDAFESEYENIFILNDNKIIKINNIKCNFIKNIRSNYQFKILETNKNYIKLQILNKKINELCIIRYTGIILNNQKISKYHNHNY